MSEAQLALIGDLHASWDDADTDYFNASRYELLLFTGDLGSSGPRNGVSVARSLARLSRPALVMLGNNDAAEYARISAELRYRQGRELLLRGLESRAPAAPSSSVRACGLDAHRFEVAGLAFTVIAGRPFAMGNSELSSPAALRASYGVASLEECRTRLFALVDGADTEHLIFLAHNGPSGLGAESDAPWGRDFHPDAGDWGDDDLEAAVAHARATGRRVLAVVAGHMHWRLRGGGLRRWYTTQDDTLYVNAARVPRAVRSQGALVCHHCALTLSPARAEVREIAVERSED